MPPTTAPAPDETPIDEALAPYATAPYAAVLRCLLTESATLDPDTVRTKARLAEGLWAKALGDAHAAMQRQDYLFGFAD